MTAPRYLDAEFQRPEPRHAQARNPPGTRARHFFNLSHLLTRSQPPTTANSSPHTDSPTVYHQPIPELVRDPPPLRSHTEPQSYNEAWQQKHRRPPRQAERLLPEPGRDRIASLFPPVPRANTFLQPPRISVDAIATTKAPMPQQNHPSTLSPMRQHSTSATCQYSSESHSPPGDRKSIRSLTQ